MALTSSVVKNYDNGYVKIEIGQKNREPKYYLVPENNADTFEKEYKTNAKKMTWASSLLMVGVIVATLLPLSAVLKKIENKTAQTLCGITAGVIGGMASLFISNNIERKSHSKLLQKFNAKPADNKTPELIQ